MSIAKLLDKAYDNILRFNGYEIILLFDKDNNIWVSYNDILKSIGYNDFSTQKKRFNLNSKYFNTYENIYPHSKLNKINLKNQQPHLKLINESGIYLILSKSQKRLAKELSEQLFTQVLPELRKSGKFVLNTLDKKNMDKTTKKLKLYQSQLKMSKKNLYLPDTTGNGYIYIIEVKTPHDGKDTPCYKIGYTTNIEKRIATYKTGNPNMKLIYHENINCNRKQLEKCILNLNHLKLLKNRTEIICNTTLEELKNEIKDCKKILNKYSRN
jgi:prophage antirepressor-like protein